MKQWIVALAALAVATACGGNSTDGTGSGGTCAEYRTIAPMAVGTLSGKCVSKPLETDSSGHVDCSVIEVIANDPGALDCNRPGRIDLSTLPNGALLLKDARSQLSGIDACGGTGQPSCDSYLFCGIRQLDASVDSSGATECENANPVGSGVSGFCYVADNAEGQQIGSPDLLANCPPDSRQLLRVVGQDPNAPLPASGATYVIACQTPGC